jgi:C-terminal processing protease CtpA/Prc
MLAHFALDIDYGHGVIWFEPQPGYGEPPFNRAGLRAIKQGPEAFDVVLVSPDSPATAAGLTQGDRILAVDGKPAPELSGSDLRAKLLQPVGTAVRLEVQRGSEAKRQITLRLAEALP